MVRWACLLSFLTLTLLACSSTTNVVRGPGSPDQGDGRRESVPCKAGEITAGIFAFDQTAEGGGAACDPLSVLDDDGTVAVVGRPAGTHSIDGKEVSGCIGVEFGDAITIASVVMKMQPVGGGCGHTCKEENDGCGSGGTVVVFTGATMDRLDFLQTMALTEKTAFEYRVSVGKEKKARFAVVCRDAAGAATDALAIDWIAGLCY